jgi:hypothetical protein
LLLAGFSFLHLEFMSAMAAYDAVDGSSTGT